MEVHGRPGRLEIGVLLALEARAHRWPRRSIREVAGGLLVHDPNDPEPVFNRLVNPVVPVAVGDWEAWLDRLLDVFERISRRPHLWLTLQPQDPAIARLERAGFGHVGASRYMFLDDPSPLRRVAAPDETLPPGAELERIDMRTLNPTRAARDIAAVIADAFGLDPAFHVLVEADVVQMLEVTAISFVLLRHDGEPVAAARRTTEGGASLLAAIGTRRQYRGRGFGRAVTAAATRDALAAGSETVFLGVEEGNDPARHLYERLGYTFADGGVSALLRP